MRERSERWTRTLAASRFHVVYPKPFEPVPDLGGTGFVLLIEGAYPGISVFVGTAAGAVIA